MERTITPTEALRQALKEGLSATRRGTTFDLDDKPEKVFLKDFPVLNNALDYIEKELYPKWQDADRKAIQHQSKHRKLAKTAIFFGACAIIFAILLLVITKHIPSWTIYMIVLEILSVVIFATSLAIGISKKLDKNWLCERNKAERLRILKFESLGWPELWSGNRPAWEERLNKKLGTLSGSISFDESKAWAILADMADNEEVDKTKEVQLPPEETIVSSVPIYYLYKRMKYQEAFFLKKSKDLGKASKPWKKLSIPVVVMSIFFVIMHYLSGGLKARSGDPSDASSNQIMEIIETWSIAFAAIMPVIGLAGRAWLGAFEPHRGADHFEWKLNMVRKMIGKLDPETNDVESVRNTILNAELMFENEHREWFLLMSETDWK